VWFKGGSKSAKYCSDKGFLDFVEGPHSSEFDQIDIFIPKKYLAPLCYEHRMLGQLLGIPFPIHEDNSLHPSRHDCAVYNMTIPCSFRFAFLI
jgi:hypothetical protein